MATFKAESKDEGNSWVEALMTAEGSSMGFESGRGVDAGMGGKSSAQAKKAAIAARMEADGDNPTVPKAGVGMVLKEMQLPGGDTVRLHLILSHLILSHRDAIILSCIDARDTFFPIGPQAPPPCSSSSRVGAA